MPRISTGVEGGADFKLVAAIVKHGAHFAVHIAHYKVVAVAQGAVLHQQRRHWSAPAIQLGFEDHAGCRTIRGRLQFLQVGHQADHFHQQVQVGFLLGRDIHEYRGPAPVFRHQAAVGQLLLDPIRQSVGLVDLVDRNNDGHFRGVSVVNGFERLRHHAVIGGHHQHDDVSGFGSARPHAGEGFVAGRVEEYDLAAVCRRVLVQNGYFVRADVLRDATGFASRHVGQADGIEQRGLAVIDVAHDGDHRRTRDAFRGHAFLARGGFRNFLGGLLFEGDHVGVRSEEARHLAGQFGVERLIDGGEHAAKQQARDQVLGAKSKLFRQIFYADAFGDGDAARDRLRLVGERQPRRRRVALHRAFFHAARHIALPGTA